MADPNIRDEAPGEARAIAEVVRRAFANAPFASETEADIVAALRAEER